MKEEVSKNMFKGRRLLSMILVFVMCFCMIPGNVFAGEQNDDTVTVYFTGTKGTDAFIEIDDNLMALVEMEVPYFDIGLYGFEDFYYNPDCYTGADPSNPFAPKEPGTPEMAKGKVTVLHAFIYATEVYYFGIAPEEAGQGLSMDMGFKDVFGISEDQGVGSTFITNFWNQSFNLNYYVNYQYPLAEGVEGIGATCDQHVLKDGDIVSLHCIGEDNHTAYGSSYSFFAVDNDGDYSGTEVVDSATVTQGDEITLTQYCTVTNYGSPTSFMPILDGGAYTSELYWTEDKITYPSVYDWSQDGFANLPQYAELESDSTVTIDTTNLEPGKYYIGAPGLEDDGYMQEITPAIFELIVEAGETTEIAVESVTLDKDSLELTVGETVELTATVLPEEAANKEVTWSSTNDNVVTVEEGKITAISAGEATITVTTMDGEKTATCEVVVKEAIPAKVELSALRIYTGSQRDMETTTVFCDEFSTDKTNYVVSTTDLISNLRFAPVVNMEGATVKVVVDGVETPLVALENNSAYDKTNKISVSKSGKLEFDIVVTAADGTEGETYKFEVLVEPTLSSLELETANGKLYLNETFEATTKEYTVDVADNVGTIDFNAVSKNLGGAYEITYNGRSSSTVDIRDTNNVVIELIAGEGSTELSNTYTISLNKIEGYSAKILADPTDSAVILYDAQGNPVPKATNGTFENLLPNATYKYVVSKYGYITVSGNITGSGDLVDGKLNVSLTKAPANVLPQLTGDWMSFRGNEQNMGVTDYATPKNASEAALKWAAKYGTGYQAAPTPPVIIDDYLYVAMAKKVVKVDKESGEVVAESGALAGQLGFALNPISYGEGMIFVPIGNGQIQALRADNLESIWVSEKIGGQTLCPITYHDGYIYAGTWNHEEKVGTYYGIAVTDEEPNSTTEEKKLSWTINKKGGFYWAGAYATDEYVIFGSDDGAPEGKNIGNAILYSVKPTTGEIIDTIDGILGDLRSTIAYDEKTESIYCTTKGGKFIKVKVNADGTFDDSTFKTLELGGMSTGTPLVYEGIAFIGVSGAGNFGSGATYKLIDVNSMTVIQSVDTVGYVQTSALLSTAYAEETGKVYVYITYNNRPGGIDVIEFDLNTRQGVYSNLYIPDEDKHQYCICSLVCDAEGTIYYKNDSCYLFAVENTSVVSDDSTSGDDSGSNGGTTGNTPGSTGGSSGGSTSLPTEGTASTETSKDNTTGENKVTATVEGKETTKGGETKATVSAGVVNTAIQAAVEAVKKVEAENATTNAKTEVKPEVKIEIKGDATTNKVETAIPVEATKEIVKNDNMALKLDTPIGTITFDNNALSIINDNAAGKDISFHVEKTTVDNRPAVELSVKTDNDSKVGQFGKGRVNVEIPYVLKPGEIGVGLIVRYIDDNGNKTDMPTTYDAKGKKVRFTTNHFSTYVVDYDENLAKNEVSFTDVKSGDWFKESVMALASKGIISGKGENTFAPNDNITRAEFVAILARMSGQTMPEATEKFADVKADAWYAKNVAWAANAGIVSGTGADKFSPNAKISRQDMAVMIKRYAEHVGLTLAETNAAVNFTDASSIASYATDAVTIMQKAGIINGIEAKDGSFSFAPTSNATRAQAATMIYQLIK